MNDSQIIEALIAKDNRVTEQFFYHSCRPLFTSIIRRLFAYEVDYDEFVGEFYLHLMERDAYRLRQFQGRSTIYQWMKTVAIRYFMEKRDNMIDMDNGGTLSDSNVTSRATDNEATNTAQMDVERLLALMPNKRYVYAIRRLDLDDAEPKDVARELNVTVDNLYNIKKRAITALTKIALKTTRENGKGKD